MLWRDVIDLISLSEVEVGDRVFQLSETSVTVFANKKSITRDEFYKAYANDLQPTISFEIRVAEYGWQQKLRYDGKDFNIIRTFSKDDEIVELVCQASDDVQANLARLRDTVEIWRQAFVENSMGELTPVPDRLFTVPAQVEYKGGSTDNASGVLEATNNATVTIRYRDGISLDMFIKIDSSRYDIQSIDDPYNRHKTLILTVERVIP